MRRVKKLASVVFAAALAATLVPQTALAQAASREESFRTWEQEAADVLGKSYLQVKFADLRDAGKLALPEGVSARTVASGKRTGLLLTGTAVQLSAAPLTLPQEFEFTADKPVGRLSVDALADAGVSATASVYIDGAAEAVASFELSSQMSKEAEWSAQGDKTCNVYGDARVAAGTHSVSLGIEAASADGTADAPCSVLLRSIEFAQSSLPVVSLDLVTDDADVSAQEREAGFGTAADMNASDDHSVRCKGEVNLQIPAGYAYEYTGGVAAEAVDESMQLEYIRGRGNSTWAVNNDKKPYKLKFAKKQNPFGMGKSKHWVLLANALDESLVRNRMALWLGAQLGMEYTPQCVPVDVVMNGVFLGSYLLAEQVRVEEERVAVDELDLSTYDAASETGGYLLSVRPYETDPDEDKFTTTHGFELLNKLPATEDAQDEAQRANLQRYFAYIRDYMQKTEDAIYGAGFKDADGTGYAEFMDVESLVKYWWVQEFTRNGDAFTTGSTYLYKKRGGKLFWGPLWDFDLAWNPDGDAFDEEGADAIKHLLSSARSPWVDQLKGDPRFRSKLMSFWFKTLSPVLAGMSADGGLLDTYYDETLVSWLYDKEKWQYKSDGPEPPEGWNTGGAVEKTSFRSQIDELKGTVSTRTAHIDDYIGELGSGMCAVDFVLDGKKLETVHVPAGESLEYVPRLDERKGFVFMGWQAPDAKIVDSETSVTQDTVLTAAYLADAEAIHASAIYFSVYHAYPGSYSAGYTCSYTVVPFDAQERTITWTSSDETVAHVDESGYATRTGFGTATITATLKSGASNSMQVTFARDGEDNYAAPQALSFAKKSVEIMQGEYWQQVPDLSPQPTALDSFEYASSDESVATVDENGVVHGVGAGTAQISASTYYDDEDLKAVYTLKVATSVTSIEGNALTLSEAEFTYDGKVHRPTVKTIGGKALNAGEDYTLEWSASAPVDAGVYSVRAVGKGAYAGTSAQATFKITKAANPLKVKGRTIKVKAGKLKRGAVLLKTRKVFKVSKNLARSKIVYKKTSGKAKVKVANNGKVTVGKGMVRGTYNLKVTVKQQAGKNHRATVIKNVVVRVKVK